MTIKIFQFYGWDIIDWGVMCCDILTTSLHLANQIHKLLVVKLVLFCMRIPKSGNFILFDIIWIFIVIIKYKWYI